MHQTLASQASRFRKTLTLGLLLFFVFSVPGFASPSRLRGQAQVQWVRGSHQYRFEQAILIDSAEKARFEALDDFGNTVLRFDFADGKVQLAQGSGGGVSLSEKKWKRLLSLPLSQKELIDYLLYRSPENVVGIHAERDPQGRVVLLEKKEGRKKDRYRVRFADFKKIGKRSYPQSIVIESGKSKLALQWLEVELKD